MSRIAVWDLPTRIVHWLIALLIPALWWTAEEEIFEIHMLLGQTMLALVLFRLLWGVLGGSTARFAGFVRGPRTILAFLGGRVKAGLGHNPVGALSVVAMLLALSIQVGLGLFANHDDGLYSGPLAHLVGDDASDTLGERHETFFYVLLGLIGLHLAAILFYLLVKRDNLVAPMITGARAAPAGAAPMITAPLWRLLLAIGLAAALTWWIASGLQA